MKKLRFAPLQGETAKRLVLEHTTVLKSVVLYKEGQIFTESTAALKTLAELGGPWRLLPLLLLVPSVVRDPVYRWIANNRYRWFGQRQTCRIPTPEERSLFLD